MKFEKASTIKSFYDNLKPTLIDYARVERHINNAIAASNTYITKVLFSAIYTNYKAVIWPTLGKEESYTPLTIDSCDSNSPFYTNCIKDLTTAGYHYLFFFQQNEKLPCGILISCAESTTLEPYKEDPALKQNLVETPNVTIYRNFQVGAAAIDYFDSCLKDMITVFNKTATRYSALGQSYHIIPWADFSTDIQTFLEREGATAGLNPWKTFNFFKDFTGSCNYNYTYQSKLAFYSDDEKYNLLDRDWTDDFADDVAHPMPEIFCREVKGARVNSDYNFFPIWSAIDSTVGVALSWTKDGETAAKDYCSKIIEQVKEDAKEKLDEITIPTVSDYDAAQNKANSTIVRQTFNQIAAGLKSGTKQSIQILFSAISASDLSNFWLTDKPFTLDFTIANRQPFENASQNMPLKEAIVQCLGATALNYESTFADVVGTGKYLVKTLFASTEIGTGETNGWKNIKKDATPCGFLFGYATEQAFNEIKAAYNAYITPKESK